MLVGLISDTHDNLTHLAKAVTAFNERGVEHVLHAGDFVAPFTFRILKELTCGRLTGVFGNNDGERFGLAKTFAPLGEIHQRVARLELGGRKIVMVHEPDWIDELVASARYDLIMYGHTHTLDIRTAPTLVVNPGECCGWVGQRSTVVVWDTATMATTVIDL